MALTITKSADGPKVVGNRRLFTADVTMDSSYPTGGYTISPGTFGARKILGVTSIGGNTNGGAFQPHWDTVNGKLQAYQSAGAAAAFAQVPNATNVSAVTFRLEFETIG